MTPHVGHFSRRAGFARRLVGAVFLLLSMEAFRLSARLLPAACPMRVWALSATDDFPVRWGDLLVVAGLAAATLAD